MFSLTFLNHKCSNVNIINYKIRDIIVAILAIPKLIKCQLIHEKVHALCLLINYF
jgi:hypothetical protein